MQSGLWLKSLISCVTSKSDPRGYFMAAQATYQHLSQLL